VSLGELTLVTHDERTGPERQEETLVRVHDDVPRALDSGEDAPTVLGEDEEAAVRCVDLEPEPARVGDLGDRRYRVDGAGGRASGRDDEPRTQSGRDVCLDRRLERVRSHPPALVDRHTANDALGEARDPERFLDAVVRLTRQIDDGARHFGRLDLPRVAGGHYSFEIRDARAGRQVAAGRLRVAHELGHPADE
jgi:hypothetical protein